MIDNGQTDQGPAWLARLDGNAHRVPRLDLLPVKACLDLKAGGGVDLDHNAVGRHLVRSPKGVGNDLGLRRHLGSHGEAEAGLFGIARKNRAAAAVDFVVDRRGLGRQR